MYAEAECNLGIQPQPILHTLHPQSMACHVPISHRCPCPAHGRRWTHTSPCPPRVHPPVPTAGRTAPDPSDAPSPPHYQLYRPAPAHGKRVSPTIDSYRGRALQSPARRLPCCLAAPPQSALWAFDRTDAAAAVPLAVPAPYSRPGRLPLPRPHNYRPPASPLPQLCDLPPGSRAGWAMGRV